MLKVRLPALAQLLIEIVLVLILAASIAQALGGKLRTMPALSSLGSASFVFDILLLTLLCLPLVFWRLNHYTRKIQGQAAPRPQESSPITSRRALLASTTFFLAGAGLSVFMAVQISKEQEREARNRFEAQVNLLEEVVAEKFEKPELALKSLVALHALDGGFSRQRFRGYWSARDFLRDFPGVRGFGYIASVAPDRIDQFVAAQRRDEAPDFRIRTLGPTTERHIITLIEPFEPNRVARGLDIGSEPVRMKAAQTAMRTGRASLTGVITLVQDGRRGPGFLLLVPLYRAGPSLGTIEERQAHHLGFVYSPLVAEELFQPLLLQTLGQLHFNLETRTPEGLAENVFRSEDYVQKEPGKLSAASARFSTTRHFLVAGVEFRLSARTTPVFEASLDRQRAWQISIGGISLSALLAFTLWLLARGRARAEVMATQLTAELQKLAAIAQRTNDAVVITDPLGRITWVNESYVGLTGYTAEESLGHKPGALLQCPQTEPNAISELSDKLSRRQACRVEILNRHKSGKLYWVDLEIKPLNDAAGHFNGFMAIERDVTAWRESQARERDQLQQLNAALRETEALMGTIHAHAIVSEADRHGRITRVNDAFCQISGYSREELIGQDHHIVNSGTHDRNFWLDMWRTIAVGQPWRGQICNRAKDGSLYWVDSIIAPFFDDRGKIIRYVSIRFDITRARESEQALAQERLRLQSILEGTNVGTWEWNVQTGVTRFNERWAEIIGYRLAELEPVTIDTWTRFAHPDDLKRSGELLEAHFSGQSDHYECEARVQHRDGHWVWVLDRGKVFERDASGQPLRMAGTHMDITERKRLEHALRASQEMLERAGQVAGIGGWSLDLQSQQLDWSRQTHRIHEVPEDFVPTLENAIAFYTPDSAATMTALVERAIEEGSGFDVETELITATGRRIWVRSVGEAEFVDGQAVRLIGAFQDVTARRELEQRVREQNQLLTAVLENMPGGLVAFDNDRTLLMRNRQFGALLNMPESVFENKIVRYEDLIRNEAERGEFGGGPVEDIVNRALQSFEQKSETLFERVRPSGQILEVRVQPMRGGGMLFMMIDVTARKVAEREARRADEMLRQAINTLDEAFVIYDDKDRLLICNQRYRDTYPIAATLMKPGTTFEEIIRYGAERGEYAAAIGRVEEWVAERMAQHRQAGTDVIQELGDGRYLRIVERKTMDGYTVGFRIDISDLVRARMAAEEASRSKSQFLANMSHEIRTPMNAILGMLNLLQHTELNTRQLDYAKKAEGAAQSLLGLLNDVLDFSKIEAGKMTLESAPLRTDRLLRDLSVILSSNTGTKDIEVLFDIDPRLPASVVGDSLRLKQILINLGGNAIKFTEHGTVVLRIRVLDIEADHVDLEFSVSDTGIGIAPENLHRIFEGFSQAEASTTRRFGGTGLGLAISSRLLHLMGSQIEVQSELGRGSRFSFRLVLGLSEDHEPLARLPRQDDLRKLRVLVIDDNPLARQVLHDLARPLGWTVELADSGEQALERLRNDPPHGAAHFDVIFIDWQMSGLSGAATGQQIRALLKERCPALIKVTAHGQALPAQEETVRVDGLLVKPATSSMLLDAVMEARSIMPATPVLQRRAQRRLQGLRVLVVEDNKVNQQVVQELLQAEGAQVSLAENGREGVQAVLAASTPFDGVLMDIQMPVMDGYAATRALRMDHGHTRLPIIAMTANAMDSDRQDALDCGMNAHVGKPFNLDELVRTLLEQCQFEPAATPAGLPATPAAASSTDVLQIAQDEFDLPQTLQRLGEDADLLHMILQTFEQQLRQYPEDLTGMLARGETRDAQRLLHTLKGSAATVGANRLAAVAAEGEQRLKQDGAMSPAQSSALQEQLQAAVQSADAALQMILAAWPVSEEKPASTFLGETDLETLRTELQELQTLLRSSDLQSLQAYSRLRERYGAALAGQLDDIDEAMANLDLAAAQRLCAGLLDRYTA